MSKRLLAIGFAAALAVLASSRAGAQTLRIEGSAGARDITGIASPSPLYPISALEEFDGVTRRDATGFVTRLFGETLRFFPGSPFFVARDSTFQLAFAPQQSAGALALPEQFYLQWLPSHFASNVEYRDGILRLKSSAAANPRPDSRTTTGSQATSPAASPQRSTQSAPSKRIVVIDAGHGGIDSGASGPDGLEEKDVCLMISNRLAAVLRSRGYEVHMTRTTDTLISLGDRPRLANQWKGEQPGALYISIHNNSLRSAPNARGFETFFLADANTSDERRVADMENASIKYEKNVRGPSSGLDQVLNGLRNDFYLRASNAFADVVQQGLARFHPGPNRGVKRAGFRVLIGALMPAVLVEVGFISNPQEAALLGSSAFQDKIAYSLAESVDVFFRDNEPLWVRQ